MSHCAGEWHRITVTFTPDLDEDNPDAWDYKVEHLDTCPAELVDPNWMAWDYSCDVAQWIQFDGYTQFEFDRRSAVYQVRVITGMDYWGQWDQELEVKEDGS